jgi:hypothetical protein
MGRSHPLDALAPTAERRMIMKCKDEYKGVCRNIFYRNYLRECKKPCDKITPLTNADRIRAMSDEELMQFLFNEVSNNTICSFCVPTMRTKCKCDGHCKNGILEWLKQPAEE